MRRWTSALFLLAFFSILMSCSDSGTGGDPTNSEVTKSSLSLSSSSQSTVIDSSRMIPVTIDCGAGGTCSPHDTIVPSGSQLLFLFKASDGFYLDSVLLNDSLFFAADTAKGYYGSYNFTYGNIQSAQDFKIRFKKLPAGSSQVTVSSSSGPVPITIDCGAGGTCTPGDTAVAPGSNLTITFKAESGKMVQRVEMDGEVRFRSDTTKTLYLSFTSKLESIYKPHSFLVRFIKQP